MSTNQNNALAAVTTLTATIGVKNEDVIAIAVSRRERALKASLTRVKKEWNDARSSMTSLKSSLNSALDAQASEQLGSRLGDLNAALLSLGDSTQFKAVWQAQGTKYVVHSRATIKDPMLRHHTQYQPSMVLGGEELQITPEITALQDQIEATAAKIESCIDQVAKLNDALNNIGEVERAARAQIAEATLSTTAEGRALLEVLDGIPGLMEVQDLRLTLEIGGE